MSPTLAFPFALRHAALAAGPALQRREPFFVHGFSSALLLGQAELNRSRKPEAHGAPFRGPFSWPNSELEASGSPQVLLSTPEIRVALQTALYAV